MFVPLGTDRERRRPTLVSYVLIGLNVGVTAVMLGLRRFAPEQFEQLYQALWLQAGVTGWWTYLTYAFLHDVGSFWHLLGNMLFLWVFGPNVEDRLGRFWFLVFYLAGAVLSGGAFALLGAGAGGVSPPLVGASGAISAVGGAFLVLFPFTRIRTLVIFFLIGVVEIPALWYLGFHLFWDFVLIGAADNVAREAHLGGYAFGAAVCATLVWLKILPREPYDLFSIVRQRARKRKFREFNADETRERQRAERRVSRSGGALDARSQALANVRAEVSSRLTDRDFEGAGEAYRRLLERRPDDDDATTLPRDTQINLANGLFKAGDHATAATAYERFLRTYANDRDAATVKLMLGLLYANYLERSEDSKPLLREAESELDEGEERELARTLLAELGER